MTPLVRLTSITTDAPEIQKVSLIVICIGGFATAPEATRELIPKTWTGRTPGGQHADGPGIGASAGRASGADRAEFQWWIDRLEDLIDAGSPMVLLRRSRTSLRLRAGSRNLAVVGLVLNAVGLLLAVTWWAWIITSRLSGA